MSRPTARLAALSIVMAACAAPPQPRPLAPGASAPGPAVGLGPGTEAAAGVLTYAVAFAGERVLASVELDTGFTLVVRDIAERGAQARTRHRIHLGPPDYDVGDLAIDPARGEAWVASRDGTVRGFALDDAAPVGTWHLGSPATAVAVSADGRFVATATEDGVLCLRRREDGALLQCVAAHQARIAALDFEAGALASGAWDGTVVLWDVPSLAIRARRRFPGSVNDVALAPGGARVAVARSGRPPRRSPDAPPRGRADAAALVSVWDPRARTEQHLRGHRAPVTAVIWTPDGRRLISSSWDRSVCLWDPVAGAVLARDATFASLVRDVAVDPRGARIAVAAWSDATSLAGRSTALVRLLYAPRSHQSSAQAVHTDD